MDTRIHEGGVQMQSRTMIEHAQGVIREWVQLLRTKLDEAYGK